VIKECPSCREETQLSANDKPEDYALAKCDKCGDYLFPSKAPQVNIEQTSKKMRLQNKVHCDPARVAEEVWLLELKINWLQKIKYHSICTYEICLKNDQLDKFLFQSIRLLKAAPFCLMFAGFIYWINPPSVSSFQYSVFGSSFLSYLAYYSYIYVFVFAIIFTFVETWGGKPPPSYTLSDLAFENVMCFFVAYVFAAILAVILSRLTEISGIAIFVIVWLLLMMIFHHSKDFHHNDNDFLYSIRLRILRSMLIK